MEIKNKIIESKYNIKSAYEITKVMNDIKKDLIVKIFKGIEEGMEEVSDRYNLTK